MNKVYKGIDYLKSSTGLDEKHVLYYYIYLSGYSCQVPGAVATVCLIHHLTIYIRHGDLTLYRGIAFCAPTDQFSKKEGRKRALDMAITALENKKSSRNIAEIFPGYLCREVVGFARLRLYWMSEWDAKLTDREKTFFKSVL